MDLAAIRSLINDDMQAVDTLIRSSLASDVVLINQISEYIIGSGGKRLRPMIVLLSANACEYQGDKHHDLATVIEFIHTATLLHDDVVDGSDLRRGNETANAIWGNAASVLVGDFLYSRAFEMMVQVDSMRVMDILSGTTNTIAEGEVLQLLNCHDADTTEARYLEVIQRKTAKLFEAGSQLGAVLAGCDEKTEKAVADYGMYLGTAFQLIDDVLDYSSNSEEMGKNVGDDLAEGKPTLPLIRTMQQGSKEQAELVRNAIEKDGAKHIDQIMTAIESTDAIPYTRALADEQAEKAIESLAVLPETPHKEALISLARFSVSRNH